LRVLSLIEPWASLIKEKKKFIETRSWKTNYRGELYIHASLKKITRKEQISLTKQYALLDNLDFKYGYIICKCKLVDCIYMDEMFIEKMKENPQEYLCGDYSLGRYAWILEEIEEIDAILAKGMLGIWHYKGKK